MVTGYFRVEQTHHDKIGSLWRRFSKRGGINRQVFDEYYAGWESGSAILVGSVSRLCQPVPLEQITGLRSPPQSYYYFDINKFDKR